MPVYIKFTVEKFVNSIAKKEKKSINHWFEDISKDFNVLQKDKVINSFEAINNFNVDTHLNVIGYNQEKQHLEELTIKYFIEECGCDPEYLDSKGNNFFYYSPSNSLRGGEKYKVPVG